MTPSFFIIGAGKCGTTSLWTYLDKHPQIAMSRIKEPSYFSMESQFARGPDWYRSLFKKTGNVLHTGEASNSYSALGVFPDTLDRIAEFSPKAKFIYSVRHPRGRTESDWMERQKTQAVSFSDFLAKDTLYRDKNLYLRTLTAYQNRFGADRVHLIFYDDLVSNPVSTVEGCLQFLGLQSDDNLGVGKTHRSSSDFVALPSGLRKLQNNRVYDFAARLVSSDLKTKIRGLIGHRQTVSRPVWLPDDFEKFRDEFETTTAAFLKHAGRDEALWNWDFAT